MKIKSLILLLTLMSFLGHSQTVLGSNKINEYQLEFAGLSNREISVMATIQVKGDQLSMMSRPERFIPDINSWWDIITVNEIEDDSNSPIKIINISGNQAYLNRKVVGQLTIKYSVDISYIDRNYPNFNTAIGKSFNNGFFIVGKPLFIYGNWELPSKVQVSKPEGVKVTMPWKIENSMYSAINIKELVLSNIIVSTNAIGVEDFSLGKFSYSLAAFTLDEKSIDLVKEIAKDVSNYYVKTFPFDHDIRYVQLVYGVPGLNGGGEAYPNSSASAISSKNMKNSFLWRITVFHELFHMWNSHMLKGVSGSANMEWFQEGFTDYMTELALLKTGHINTLALSIFQRNSLQPLKKKFENNPENITIKNSGYNKGKNYVIVYRGGWFIANWLNKRLKKETNDEWDVERLFKQLLKKYPSNGKYDLNFEVFLNEIEVINKQISYDLEIILNATEWSTLKKYEN